MNTDWTYKNYASTIKVELKKFIKPEYNINTTVYPTEHSGSIIVFEFEKNSRDLRIDRPAETVPSALSRLKYDPIPKKEMPFLETILGTDVRYKMEKGIILKGEHPKLWSSAQAKTDGNNLLNVIHQSKSQSPFIFPDNFAELQAPEKKRLGRPPKPKNP